MTNFTWYQTLKTCRISSACGEYGRLFFFLVVCFLASGQQSLGAESVNGPEAWQRTAGTVYNLCKFIHWPESVDNTGGNEFVICVAREDGIFQELRNFQGRHVAGRPIRIRKMKGDDPGLAQCQTLFLSADTDPAYFDRILTSASQYPLLTISDGAGFTDKNGMIELVLAGDRVRFIINLNSVREASLSVAAPLLSLAATVHHD